MNLGELQDKGLALSTGNYVLDNKLLVMQNLNVGRNVSGQKWTGSLANAGRFGFALLWGSFLVRACRYPK